jgi:hypothetical protein
MCGALLAVFAILETGFSPNFTRPAPAPSLDGGGCVVCGSYPGGFRTFSNTVFFLMWSYSPLLKRFINNWKNRHKKRAVLPGGDLLISTSNQVLRLESTGQTFKPGDRIGLAIVASGQGLYFGLTPDAHGGVWVAARCSRVSDALPTEAEQGQLVPLSADPEQDVAEPQKPLRDLHDVAIQRGALWSVCSFDDTVAIYSMAQQTWSWWQPLATDPLGGPDQFHLNTLYFEEELVWVLAHRRGPSWLMAFPIEVALQGKTIEPVQKIELGQQAHNIWRQTDASRPAGSRAEWRGCPMAG